MDFHIKFYYFDGVILTLDANKEDFRFTFASGSTYTFLQLTNTHPEKTFYLGDFARRGEQLINLEIYYQGKCIRNLVNYKVRDMLYQNSFDNASGKFVEQIDILL